MEKPTQSSIVLARCKPDNAHRYTLTRYNQTRMSKTDLTRVLRLHTLLSQNDKCWWSVCLSCWGVSQHHDYMRPKLSPSFGEAEKLWSERVRLPFWSRDAYVKWSSGSPPSRHQASLILTASNSSALTQFTPSACAAFASTQSLQCTELEHLPFPWLLPFFACVLCLFFVTDAQLDMLMLSRHAQKTKGTTHVSPLSNFLDSQRTPASILLQVPPFSHNPQRTQGLFFR